MLKVNPHLIEVIEMLMNGCISDFNRFLDVVANGLP